jgi:hypothetical protein
MTESELRHLVREQILFRFDGKKIHLIEQSAKPTSPRKKPDPEVQKAVDQLVAMNAQMSSLAADAAKGDEKEKKTEVIGTVVGLAIGLPGLFHAMAKMASLAARMFNKVGGKFDPEKEGETFHHWSTATKNFYIDKLLTPIVKRVFKKQIAGNAKKARIYAEVVYAVLLAAVAVHAGIEIATHGAHAFQSLGDVAKTAFEAAHGAETGLSSAGMISGLRAAFAAVGEIGAVEALKTASQVA